MDNAASRFICMILTIAGTRLRARIGACRRCDSGADTKDRRLGRDSNCAVADCVECAQRKP